MLSICAGQGRDLLEVLSERVDVNDVSAALVERDAANVDHARRLAASVGGSRVEIVEADAGLLATYDGLVPADLVLLCGVLGNVSDDDVRRTVASLPTLCATAATVVWTRHRRAPDLTPAIRQWFSENGFAEADFVAPDDVQWSVGVHVLGVAPKPLDGSGALFRFR